MFSQCPTLAHARKCRNHAQTDQSYFKFEEDSLGNDDFPPIIGKNMEYFPRNNVKVSTPVKNTTPKRFPTIVHVRKMVKDIFPF
jgi:hypothetical protein